MSKKLVVLVTGGLGFIGSNFIRYILNTYPNYHVINLDKITYAGNENNFAGVNLNQNYTFIRGDICDFQLVDQIVKTHDVNVIINFAAESHVDRSIFNASVFIETNVLGTQTLLDIAVKNKISKYVQISTDEVYGSLNEEGYFNENTPLNPKNPYSASKASADCLVNSYYNTFKLNTSMVRFANTYGPYQFPEKLIPKTITLALHNKPIPVHGRGKSVRDWLHVSDAIRAIALVMHKGKSGEVYNIGARQERETIDVVKRILNILNKPENLINFVDDRPGQDYRYSNDPSKIINELRWQAIFDFEEGLTETINWYKEHVQWWTSLNNEDAFFVND